MDASKSRPFGCLFRQKRGVTAQPLRRALPVLWRSGVTRPSACRRVVLVSQRSGDCGGCHCWRPPGTALQQAEPATGW